MTKTDLIDKLAKDADISKAQANRAIDSLVAGITGALKKKQSVSLIGFGTFDTQKRKARTGRNPATGEEIKIKAQTVVKFRVGKKLKDAVK